MSASETIDRVVHAEADVQVTTGRTRSYRLRSAVTGDTETQYGVGGARIVWRSGTRDDGLDRDQRITIALTDLIQSTTAVIDLATGELVETGSYYANGARETYRSNETETVTPEPIGFTGKEADEEVGLTYFGQRYLMAHLGRWASPDPLQTHAVGGGEAVNGYHYVSGNVLQARDPMGLNTLFLGGAGYESETAEYASSIIARMRNAGVRRAEYVPISEGGQAFNIRRTLLLSATVPRALRLAAARDAAFLRNTGQRGVQTPRMETASLLDRIETASTSDQGRHLVGYSYGSVMAAAAALEMAERGEVVDNLILVATPMASDSVLYQQLLRQDNIRHITRIDIVGDPFSAGVDVSRAGDMDRHFFFISNERGQQDWLARTVAERTGSSPDQARGRVEVIRVDPATFGVPPGDAEPPASGPDGRP